MSFAPNGAKLMMLMRCFERPTGMAIANNWLALCCKSQILFFDGTRQLRSQDGKELPYDICFVPRRAQITGDILGHDIAFLPSSSAKIKSVAPELIVCNSRFSCLCTLDPDYSFVPLWKPPFIDQLVAEDRCHLNGIACDTLGVQYVSALGSTNSAGAWREKKASGGILMHYPSGEILVSNLCMPHSPRLYRNQLWLLESGTGELLQIDQKSGQRTTVAKIPGYLRGLAFFGDYAFVGTCKIREKHQFGGLPIEQQVAELQCSIVVINLQTGQQAGFIQFTKGIEELFDIQILEQCQNPHILGFEEETIDGVFVMP